MKRTPPTPLQRARLERALIRAAHTPNEQRDASILRVIRSIPKGKTAAYSAVAAAAGYPLYHRLVARLLSLHGPSLPWQRVTGAGGEIRLRYGSALEQRTRLEMEGVAFRGRRIDPRHILSSEDLVCLGLKSRAAPSRPR
ncbi:MAG: MGMT family protein [Candidatus Solibacter usitatus]|nr:MGMT family protein [Candidatus Solibacter usitatus]